MYQRMPNWPRLVVISMVSVAAIYVGASLISRFNLLYAKRIV
jgi:hypothetical protein